MNQDRLLTDHEFTEAIKGTRTSGEIENALIEAQDTKTASIVAGELIELLQDLLEMSQKNKDPNAIPIKLSGVLESLKGGVR